MERLKQLSKRLFVLCFALLLGVSGFLRDMTSVKAAEGIQVSKTETGYWHTGTATGPNGDYSWFVEQPINKFKLSDGKIGFCVEPWYLVHSGEGYKSSKQDIQDLSKIIYHGFWDTEQSNWDYAVTQLLIWEYYGYQPKTNVSGYASRKKEIQKQVAAHRTTPSFDGKTYTVNAGEALTLRDSKQVVEAFDDWQGENCEIKVSGNTVTITPSKEAGEQVRITAQKYDDAYIGASLMYQKKGNQSIYSGYLQEGVELSLTLQVQHYGSLRLAKVDTEGRYVADTTFRLSANEDMSDPLGTYTTQKDGTVTVSDLKPGTYYVQEVEVPEHLVLDDSVHTVQVKANQTTVFTAENAFVEGYVKLRKTDSESNKQVAGAVYGIFDENDKEIQRLTTPAQGYAASDALRFGTYYAKEVIAPPGYVLNETKYPFQIQEQEQVIEISGVDPRVKGTLVLQKEDAETKEAQGNASLQGAVYGLYARAPILDPADGSVLYETDEKVAELTTDEQGKAVLEGLYLGAYYVKESKPSPGYTLDKTEYEVDLSSETNEEAVIVKALTVQEQVIRFTVQKVQADSELVLPQTAFVHTAPDGGTQTLRTDETGQFTLIGLQTGIHTLQETQVQAGYVLQPLVVRFAVKEDGTIEMLSDLEGTGIQFQESSHTLIVENEVVDFKVKITKINEQAEALDGAEFTLYADAACTQMIDRQTTRQGELIFSGLHDRTTYYLKETKAPLGYQAAEEHVYQIYTEADPINGRFDFSIDDVPYTVEQTSGAFHVEGTPASHTLCMQIQNRAVPVVATSADAAALWPFAVLLVLAACSVTFLLWPRSKGK